MLRARRRTDWELDDPGEVRVPFRRPRLRRRTHRARTTLLGVLGLAVLLCLLSLIPIASGWTSLPILSHQSALQALDDARAVQAERWAPEILADAERILREGLQAERHEEAQLLPLRDFRDTDALYRAAEARAREARTGAMENKEAARERAQDALDSTRAFLAAVERVASQMPFPDIERIRLQQARTHTSEAEAFITGGELEEACEVAQLAALEAEMAVSRAMPLAARFVDDDEVRQWRRWVDETVAWSRSTGGSAVVVYKEKNLVRLYDGGRPVKVYAADMGRNSLNRKIRSGDQATPEGRYRITAKKGRGNSKYFMALALDYPNAEDRRRFEQARRSGEIPHYAKLGGLIEIHGEGGRGDDWTLGCVALSNEDMKDLYSRVSVGTPVTIVGGDGENGTFSNLARASAAGHFTRKSQDRMGG